MEFQGVEGKKYCKIPGDRESFDEVPGGTVSGHSQQGAWTISFLYVMNDFTKVVNVRYFSKKDTN